jgi:sugar O-acyltransferase (sialic acid O-acetyltransferase NeuD family)
VAPAGPGTEVIREPHVSARDVVLVGGGGHARVVAEAIRSRPELFRLLGFVDPSPCAETARRLSLPRLGDDGWLHAAPAMLVALGVGDVGAPTRRLGAVASVGAGREWATIVHAQAWVSPTAMLSAGAVVMAGAAVQSGAQLHAHSLVNTGAIVEHDAVLGQHAQLGPRAAVGGGVVIGARTFVGLGAAIRDHVTLGDDVVVAMGAVVVGDLARGSIVAGVPARSLSRTR